MTPEAPSLQNDPAAALNRTAVGSTGQSRQALNLLLFGGMTGLLHDVVWIARSSRVMTEEPDDDGSMTAG